MASDPAADPELQSLFEKLDGCISVYQYKKALKFCADNTDALAVNAVLLVELGHFSEALVFMKKHQHLEQTFAFEREALTAAAAIDASNAEAAQQLQAQLQYRTDRGADSLATYTALRAAGSVDPGELAANTVAAALLAGRPEDGLAVASDKSRGAPRFETVFNAACCSLALGQAAQAEEQLLLAQRLGQELLFEEGCEEAEVEAELAPLATQLAYTYSQLGQVSKALDMYTELAASKAISDDVVVAIIRNNNTADRLHQQSNKKLQAEALKKIEGLMDKTDRLKLRPELQKRLGTQQKLELRSNYAILLALGGRADAARQLLQQLQQANGAETASLLLLQGALAALDHKAADADAVLAKLASSSPDHALPASLLRAQAAAATGNLRGAVSVLQELNSGPLAHRPGVVASVVGLLAHVGESAEAEAVLQRSLQHWQGQSGSDERTAALQWLLQQLATLKLKTGDAEAALQLYKQLHGLTGTTAGGLRVLSRLACVLALRQPQAVEELQRSLPELRVDMDSTALEQECLADVTRRTAVSGILPPRGALPDEVGGAPAGGPKTRARRRRTSKKKRLPKGFDPENPGPPPNPERWLPKWQRSDYKKKRGSRHRAKEVVKGSQGAGKVDESLDIASAAGAARATKNAAPQLPAKIKKGKGRR